MSEEDVRQRVVLLGAGRVGKTCILSRFLSDSFKSSYRETVEDLHCREYDVRGVRVRVDFLDTAGNFTFPAMRRLSISTAQGFLLVYSLDDWSSFQEIQQLREQIKEQRSSYHKIPCIIVGNKCDLPEPVVDRQDVADWLESEQLQDAHFEVSAKDNVNITEIFRKMLDIAKLPQMQMVSSDDAPIPTRKKSVKSSRRMSAFAIPSPGSLTEFNGGGSPNMSRSRSLIRRKKSQPKLKDAPDPTKNDCVIS